MGNILSKFIECFCCCCAPCIKRHCNLLEKPDPEFYIQTNIDDEIIDYDTI